jgi:hypothetical protein
MIRGAFAIAMLSRITRPGLIYKRSASHCR